MFTVQLGNEEFRIVGPAGEEGTATEYGDVATLRIGDAIFYCVVDDPNDGKVLAVIRVDRGSSMDTTAEEVEFQGDDEEDEIEEGGGPVLVAPAE